MLRVQRSRRVRMCHQERYVQRMCTAVFDVALASAMWGRFTGAVLTFEPEGAVLSSLSPWR